MDKIDKGTMHSTGRYGFKKPEDEECWKKLFGKKNDKELCLLLNELFPRSYFYVREKPFYQNPPP